MTAAVRPGSHCAVDRAAFDGSSVPVLNGVAVSGIQRTAVQEQIAAIDLDHDEVILGKRTALDIQTGVLGDVVVANAHQGCALRSAGAAVVGYVATLEGEPAAALNVNDIVGADAGVLCGVLTHDGARLGLAGVHDGNASRDRQRRLALARAAVEGVAVQVERDIGRGDRYVLLRIGQQLHHCPFLSSVNCRLQAGIALAGNFRNPRGSSFGHTKRAITVLVQRKAVSKKITRNLGSERTRVQIELGLRGIGSRACRNVEVAANTRAVRVEGNFFGASLDSLLDKALSAVSC